MKKWGNCSGYKVFWAHCARPFFMAVLNVNACVSNQENGGKTKW